MDNLRDADFGQFKISVVMTRDSVEQLDDFERLARDYGAELRLTRLRPRAAAPTSGTICTPLSSRVVPLTDGSCASERVDGRLVFHLSGAR